MKSAMGSNSEVQNSDCHVRIGSDSVAKLGKRRLTRNNRIGAKDFLNRCCALVAVLESMLPARAPKIVLQQNLPYPDLRTSDRTQESKVPPGSPVRLYPERVAEMKASRSPMKRSSNERVR